MKTKIKSKTNTKHFFVIALLFLLIVFSSCSKNKVSSIERMDLWKMSIGRLEDEIDLFDIEGRRRTSKTAVRMRDGLFYISNGNGQKVVRYNSYGDLLFMIYNEETNPPPITLRSKSDSESVTRWAYPWPLREPGCIAVNSNKHIFVEDTIPDERQEFSKDDKVLLNSVVLHFDENGRFIEYLGQEGPGGTPFPGINEIYSSINDEVAVVCHLPKTWNVWWFSPQGKLLYVIKFNLDELPVPPDHFGLFPSLDSVTVTPDARKILLKIDYYRELRDESTNTITGREPDSSYIWVVDSETASYTSHVLLPFYESVSIVNNKKTTEDLLYSMFGAMRGGNVFLYFPVEEGLSILLLPLNNASQQRRGLITMSQQELQFCAFDISAEGILSALLGTNNDLSMVWWRTDKLARDM
ncbi:MAG: lipoprotein [Termitinemataceae bacterium]|nr:MAG: lipoprotein [Termitinemataceae bacterium]